MGTRRIRQGATHSRLKSIGIRLITTAALLGVLVTGTILSTGNDPAWATDYPSWGDVEAARRDQASAEAQIRQIEAILAGLQAEAARTQADAEAKGNLYQEADQKFQAAAAKAAALQEQADAANAVAAASEQRAGQMAAQLMRSGGGDVTANLFVSSDADNLLYGLGMSSKISEQANAIYERAILDQNTAQALTDQADVAKRELEVLKIAAEKAFAEAQAAAAAAQAALNEQLDNQARLQQQLVVLRERRAATEADYQAGVRERYAAASFEAGPISDSGWVRPAGGYITSSFGNRTDPYVSFHSGVDLGAGCNANIFAAHEGTVTYASYGWNGGYGNYIVIDHGGGISTAYGHIVAGGILVNQGEHVDPAQNIARVGSTGSSTGCHLHFEVRLGGTATNPVPYMAGQGIRLG
jgi:murein DD-endopeptidase MepM/ murein hydrolase activator NlpD